LIRRVLAGEGYGVSEAHNGEEAINSYRLEPADLVITDLFMPEKDGLELIRELRSLYPDAKIIAISGGEHRNTGIYLRAAQALGASRTLAKPFSTEELLAAVRDALE